jgi:multicomponent Na+:H+ antiporter subunit B
VTRRARVLIFVPALAAVGALLVWAYVGLPDFGHYRGPYGYLLNGLATPERHMTNVVNATTYDIRGFDTLGEEFILFGAVTGVVLLLRSGEGEREEDVDDTIGIDLIRVFGVLAVAAVILVGLWIVSFGFVTPGGGFQGGVAIASGVVLIYLASSYRAWAGVGIESFVDPFEGVGAGGYAAIGLGALVAGMPFLTNFLGPGIPGTLWSGGSAALVNWSAGIEVAAANVILYTEFLEEYVVPLARRSG